MMATKSFVRIITSAAAIRPGDAAAKGGHQNQVAFLTFPDSTHSSSAIGIEADDVLPCIEIFE